MLYFDTSFLVPLILPEATSTQIAELIGQLAVEQLTISHWTRVEFASLLAREVRMGGLSAEMAAIAGERFEEMVEQSFTILSPGVADFNLAREYLGKYETGLRAGDALHLAVASSHDAKTIYTLDKVMLKAGSIIGLPMSAGI